MSRLFLNVFIMILRIFMKNQINTKILNLLTTFFRLLDVGMKPESSPIFK